MSDKTKRLIYLIYGIIQSLLLVLCGVCLIIACLSIYDGGNGSFSRAAVGVQFKKFMIPLILCLAGLVVGMVLSLILPREPKKVKGQMAPADAIRRLEARIDPATCPHELIQERKQERTLRLILRIAATVVCVAVAIPCCIHLFNLSNFDDTGKGLTEDILAAMMWVLPAAAVGLSAWVVVTLVCHYSLKRELSLVKEALKVAPKKEKSPSRAEDTRKKRIILWSVRGGVLLVALVFIILGIFNGGMKDVLEKAIRICTECIGLG